MCKNNATCIDCAKGEVQRSGGNIFTFTGPVLGESRDLVYPFPLALLPPLSIILFAQDAFAFTCLCRIYVSKGYRTGGFVPVWVPSPLIRLWLSEITTQSKSCIPAYPI